MNWVAPARKTFLTKSPECINSALYILNYSIKNRYGKNHPSGEEIFGLILIFGRDKTEIFVKIEKRVNQGSESPPPAFTAMGESKKHAKLMKKIK